MRFLFKRVLFLAIILGLVACGETNVTTNEGAENVSETPELADELKLLVWAEYLSQDVLDDFSEEFGVEVIYDTHSTSEELFTKIKSGATEYYIIIPTHAYVPVLIENDLLAGIDKSNIPNLDLISNKLKDVSFDPGNTYTIPYAYGTMGIIYNKEKVDKPTSWEDLWNPEYKDRVIVNSDVSEIFEMPLQMLGYDIINPTKEQLLEAKEKLADLHPNVLKYDSSASADFINENAWIGMVYNSKAGVAIRENPNIDYVLPEEGGIIYQSPFAIPKNSQSKYTAEVFINYMLEPEVGAKSSEEMGTSNPNPSAVELMSEEARNNPALSPTEESLENAEWETPAEPEKVEMKNRMFKEIQEE